jgi:UDP-N-acetylmuramate--alanine ligase
VEHRSEALARIANQRRLVAVSGTHGKTTTSAMVVAALEAQGMDPSYAIGSELTGRGSGARLGAGDVMVIEADESDGSFLNYSPEVAVVTNVEPDHLDHYGDEGALVQAFRDFAARVRTPGVLIACEADPGAAALAEWARNQWDRQRPGLPGRPQRGPNATPLVWDYGEVVSGPPLTALPGRHMALNAAAAYRVAQWFRPDLDPARIEAVQGALRSFSGTARRFELRGEARGVRVFDDYAHHPTEVAATLAAAREEVGRPRGGAGASEGRLLVVFQPHLYSRTRQFQSEFAAALGAADRVWLLDVYGAREEPEPGVTSALIADRMPRGAVRLADRRAVAAEVAAQARGGDVVFTMGAGDVTALGPAVLAALGE